MPHITIRPRTVARLSTVALWAVGSAYLLKTEFAAASPDPVVMASTPVIWAVVIALPILATYARRDGQWIATALIWLAASVGSIYTLQATVSRQASVRDTAVISAVEIVRQRDRVQADLETASANLADAQRRCGQGRVCNESTKALIAIYERQSGAHAAKLETLKLPAASAGERRIAWLLTLSTGYDAATVAEAVAMLLPALFGLTLELAAFALAMYGWHPESRQFPTFAAPETSRKLITYAPPKHPVIAALEKVGKPVSNGELARLMGVTAGEASKRRKEVESLLRVWREGQHLMASLA